MWYCYRDWLEVRVGFSLMGWSGESSGVGDVSAGEQQS